MLTISGYYDFVPESLMGKLVGSFCAVTGLFCLSFPVPVIVSNFTFLYQRDRATRNAKTIALQLLNTNIGKNKL
jgi:hypothetical protein